MLVNYSVIQKYTRFNFSPFVHWKPVRSGAEGCQGPEEKDIGGGEQPPRESGQGRREQLTGESGQRGGGQPTGESGQGRREQGKYPKVD